MHKREYAFVIDIDTINRETHTHAQDAPYDAVVPALGPEAGAAVAAAGAPGLRHTQPGAAPASPAARDLRARTTQGTCADVVRKAGLSVKVDYWGSF